jgi:hypothetical protein
MIGNTPEKRRGLIDIIGNTLFHRQILEHFDPIREIDEMLFQ